MLLRIDNLNKSIGSKDLFENLNLIVNEGEKLGIVGRNGLGKTTLFRIITGEDKEYTGSIELAKGISIVMTRQEHFMHESMTALDYILSEVPDYNDLQNTIRKYEANGENEVTLEAYCDAIALFGERDYYSIEGRIIESLKSFQLDEERILQPFVALSGGEKRFVELVRVMYSGADIALIDEPTNHMDYVGKERFIQWLKNIDKCIIVITHDRDVLKYVDRILELKERKVTSFSGNYDAYLKQNSLITSSGITSYEEKLKCIAELKRQILDLGRRGAKDRSIKIMEDRFKRELERLEEELVKPSFWIDKESLESIDSTIAESYHKYKEKNITILQKSTSMHKKLLLDIKRLSVGYEFPLFNGISFDLYYGDRIFVKGRNGAGKSTFVKTIRSFIDGRESEAKVFNGEVKTSSSIKLGVYEQEIDTKYLSKSLGQAITELYFDHDIPINDEKLKGVMKQFLFNPETDMNLTFERLSGGQKARFQIIKMFINEPNLLILDEPTNHLDLPSIEELERTLTAYHGGIIYISHDSYFIETMGGNSIQIGKDD